MAIKKALSLGALLLASAIGCENQTNQIPANSEIAVAPTPRPVDPNKKSLVFIIDTSESMDEKLNGIRKIDGAKEALTNILEDYSKYNSENHNLEAALYCFKDGEVERLIPLQDFNYELLRSNVQDLRADGGTPISRSLDEAEKELDEKGNGRRYIILLTDGQNTSWKSPEKIFEEIKKRNEEKGDYETDLMILEYDTNRKYFVPLEKLGAKSYEAKNKDELIKAFKETKQLILEEIN